MNLHLDKATFKDAITATAQYFKIREVFIEKDYWVVHSLKNLSLSPHKDETVFKGGTSLSKAWKIIDRFSEDIDLAVIENGRTANQIKILLKKVEQTVAGDLPEIQIDGVSQKYSKIRKTYFSYDKVIGGDDFAQAHDKLLIEANCFTQPIPHETRPIQTYIADFLIQTERRELIRQYGLEPILVNVLHYERTFLEKTLAMVKRSYKNDLKELQDKVRHIYDLHMIVERTKIIQRFEDEGLFKLMDHVQADEYKMGQEEWTTKALGDCDLFCQTEKVWKELESTYSGTFKPLVFGDFPAKDDILTSLDSVSRFLRNYDKYLKK